MKKMIRLTLLIAFLLLFSYTTFAETPIYINGPTYPIKQNTLVLNNANTAGDILLQFGNTLAKILRWDTDATDIGGDATGLFSFNDGVEIYEDNTETGAGLGLTIANDGTGDSILQLLLNGAQRWVLGIDNSDLDKFKIASTADLNTNARLTIDTAGNMGINDSSPDTTLSIRPNASVADADYLLKAYQTPTQAASLPTFGIVGDGSFVMDANGDPIWFGVYNGGLVFAGNYDANSELTNIDLVGNTNWGPQSPSVYGSTQNKANLDAGNGNFQTDGTISVDGIGTSYILGNLGAGTNSPGSTLDVKGTLRLSGATSGYVGFTPALAAGSTTYTLPSTDGTNGQLLTTNGTGTLSWSTASASSGDITAVGSMLSGDAFSDATADDDWLGLGAAAGRIEFDDQATDEINFLNSRIGIGTSTPLSPLDIQQTNENMELGNGAANDAYINFDDGTDRNFGWDDNYSANHTTGTISTFNNELAYRTIQSGSTPVACSATVAGMQWMDTDTGMVYVCDTSNGRNKWLTFSDNMTEGEQSGTCNSGADIGTSTSCAVARGGSLGSDNNIIGLYIPHPITITGYGFSEDDDACTSGSFDIELWSTGTAATDQPYSLETNIATALTGQAHNSNTLNLDVAGNQYINWGMDNNCGQNIDDFSVVLYYRYKHD